MGSAIHSLPDNCIDDDHGQVHGRQRSNEPPWISFLHSVIASYARKAAVQCIHEGVALSSRAKSFVTKDDNSWGAKAESVRDSGRCVMSGFGANEKPR